MLGLLIASALASGATAYAIGYAFIAPADSFFKSKTGAIVLVGLGLTFLFLPPQLMSMGSLSSIAGPGAASLTSMFTWPAGLNRELYRFVWIALMIAGLATGMRIWDFRKPGWRPGSLDETSAGRAQGLLPLADSLQEALEVLQRAKLTARDVDHLAPQLKLVGRRFGYQLPETNSAAYNLIVRYVPPSVAAAVTGHILDGAVRLDTRPTGQEPE